MALRKIAKTTEVAHAIAWLCSQRAAGHISGQASPWPAASRADSCTCRPRSGS
jgi:hypothetical protein